MAEITAEQLNKARQDMLKAGYTESEVDDVIEPFVAQLEAEASGLTPGQKFAIGAPVSGGELGLAGTQSASRFILPFTLGSIGSGLGARLSSSPAAARSVQALPRMLRIPAQIGLRMAQPTGEFAGQAAGDILGRGIEGVSQNLSESMATAGIGTLAGTGFRLATKTTAGYLGNVPRFAIDEAGVPTAGVLPSFQKVVKPSPTTSGQVFAGVSGESRLADKVRAAVRRLMSKVTPQRAEKVRILRQADMAGVRINVDPILTKILDETPAFRAEPSTVEFANHLDKFANNLVDETVRRGGSLTPSQLDEFIRTNLAPKSFTNAGAPAQTRVGPVIREIKKLSTDLLNNHLPPNVRELNTKITTYLDQAEDASALFSEEKSGVVGKLRNLYRPGNEENTQALEFLSKETDKSISREARTLATKRAFTLDPRETRQSGGYFSARLARPAELIGQFAAPLQPFAGPAVGGLVAKDPYGTPGIGDIMRSIADLIEAQRHPTPLLPQENK